MTNFEADASSSQEVRSSDPNAARRQQMLRLAEWLGPRLAGLKIEPTGRDIVRELQLDRADAYFSPRTPPEETVAMIPRGWRVAHHITPDPPRQSLFQETSFAPERPDNPLDLNEDSVVLLPDGVLLLLGGHTRIEEGNRGVMSRTARILTDGLLWALGESKEGRPKQITDIAIIQDGLERLLSVHGLEQEYNQFAGINDEIA